MCFYEWIKKYNVDLSQYHGNVGDLDGNGLCIKTKNGWIFWGKYGQEDIPKEYYK